MESTEIEKYQKIKRLDIDMIEKEYSEWFSRIEKYFEEDPKRFFLINYRLQVLDYCNDIYLFITALYLFKKLYMTLLWTHLSFKIGWLNKSLHLLIKNYYFVLFQSLMLNLFLSILVFISLKEDA